MGRAETTGRRGECQYSFGHPALCRLVKIDAADFGLTDARGLREFLERFIADKGR